MKLMTYLKGCVAVAAAVAALGIDAPRAEIVIGASLPLSGPLAGFGSFQQWGYKRAVEEVNKSGGIEIDGKKEMVKLVIRDDKTDPNATAANTESLISRDRAVALLGSCTPALVNAGALVAERAKKPVVTGCDPLEAFKSVRKWNYVWDIFFHEPELAVAELKAVEESGVQTNKKLAIWHDNGPDGQVVGGKLWPEVAKSFGYEVVQNAEFPVDNSYAAAEVLLDAIAAAASTDPEKINAALAKTDKTYVVGPVKFDENHTAKLPIVALQWQDGKTVIVWPKSAKTGEFLFPLP